MSCCYTLWCHWSLWGYKSSFLYDDINCKLHQFNIQNNKWKNKLDIEPIDNEQNQFNFICIRVQYLTIQHKYWNLQMNKKSIYFLHYY